MAVITNNLEWHDNMYIRKFVKETRVGGEVQSLTIKLKAYKLDAIGTLAGDGNMLSYNDQSITVKTRSGKDYYDFDNATPVLEKSFSYTVPSTDITSTTQISDQSEYFGKYKNWIQTYSLSEECENCYNLLWSDLETMNVSW